jgi:arylsulfatase
MFQLNELPAPLYYRSSMDRRSFLAAASAKALAQPKTPNIVVIYADDLGYGDLGCYGGALRTPNLDRLAAEGVRFTHAYSANPVCSPSRAALLTGRYPTRVGVPHVLFPHSTTGLAEGETTLAQMLKPSGYKTMCVGKWHLGHLQPYLPDRRGFDGYFGIPYSNDMSPRVLLSQTGGQTAVVEREATLAALTPRYTEQATKFIRDSKASPFFLYMPHTYPHIPLDASPRFRGKSKYGMYGDVVEELDWSVGQVLEAIQSIGAVRNTLVMFSSDNGPWHLGSPGRLRGRKGSTLEGGVRVPFIANMPGRVAKGKVADGVISTMDVLPTVAALTGASLPDKPLDGIGILDLLEGRSRALDREALLYFDGWNLQCARWKQWKLHFARYNGFAYSPPPAGGRVNLPLKPYELYNVVEDVDESFDVAPENPQVVKEIEDRVLRLIPGFPDDVGSAWGQTIRRKTRPSDPGRLPGLAPL